MSRTIRALAGIGLRVMPSRVAAQTAQDSVTYAAEATGCAPSPLGPLQ